MGNVNSYNQLMDIAKNAYGSGAFEGAKGGNGYVGQYVDSEGKTHVVKVLTHRDERSDYAKLKAKYFTQELAWATHELKSSLIAIAGGEGTELGKTIKKMLDDAQAKAVDENMTAADKDNRKVGLLSRKIVAQAVSAIAKSETVKDANGVAFSWDAVNDKNRAATVKDTSAGTVRNLIADKAKGVGGAKNVQVMKEMQNEHDALEETFGHNWKMPIPKWGAEFEEVKSMADNLLLGFRQAQTSKTSLRRKLLEHGCLDMGIKAELYCALLMKLKGVDGEKVFGNGKKAQEMTLHELFQSPGNEEKVKRLDAMNARELLEELKDVLDCDESDKNLPLGQFTFALGLRLALETLASEEPPPEEVPPQDGNKINEQPPKQEVVQPEINELPPKQEMVQPEINELPPQQPKAKIKLPAAEDVRKCKTFEQLRELAKNAYAEIGKVDRDGMRLIDVMDVRQSALKQTFKLVFLEKHPGKAWKMSPYDMLDEKMADKIVNTTDDFSFEDVERIVREAFEKHPIPEESLVDEVPEEPRNMEAFEPARYDEGEE